MREYYAVGVKKKKDAATGEVAWVSQLIPLSQDCDTRIKAENQANRIAKRDKIVDVKVYPVQNKQPQGGILTKNMKAQKAARRNKK